jgi:hypothetical protein
MIRLWALLALAGAVFGANERLVYTSDNRIVVAGWNNYVWTQPDVAIPRPESCVLWLACDKGNTVRSYGRLALTGMWDNTNCTGAPPQSVNPDRWTFSAKQGVRFSNGGGTWTNLLDGTKPYSIIVTMSRSAANMDGGCIAIGNASGTPDYAGFPYCSPNFIMQNPSGYDRRMSANPSDNAWTNRMMYSMQYDGSFSVDHMHAKTNCATWVGSPTDLLSSKVTWSTGDIEALGIGRNHAEEYNSGMVLYWVLIYDVELTDAELATIYAKLY